MHAALHYAHPSSPSVALFALFALVVFGPLLVTWIPVVRYARDPLGFGGRVAAWCERYPLLALVSSWWVFADWWALAWLSWVLKTDAKGQAKTVWTRRQKAGASLAGFMVRSALPHVRCALVLAATLFAHGSAALRVHGSAR